MPFGCMRHQEEGATGLIVRGSLTGSETLVPHDRKAEIRYKFMLLIQIYLNIVDR